MTKPQRTATTTTTSSGTDADLSALERPNAIRANAASYGSDVVAETLREIGIPYIALNPGASYRGLHDSLVNHLGNRAPQMLLCLHEESAVAIAHGYAKVTGRAMAVALHSNVGLMHATMAIFNAWCDRAPVLLLGATGPVDAMKRRPWIDWIHTAADQGALIRSYTKWDDQPASAGAARESLLRGAWLANTFPKAPVYINLDAEMQEAKLPEPLPPVDAARFMPAAAAAAPAQQIRAAADALLNAKRPLILMGRASRSLDAWNARVALAEKLGAGVVTDLKTACAFPTDHPLAIGAPGMLSDRALIGAIQEADVVLSLDWVDLAGAFKAASAGSTAGKTVIHVSSDHQLHRGWSMDYQGLPPVDMMLAADPEFVVPDLLAALGERTRAASARSQTRPAAPTTSAQGPLTVDQLAATLRDAVGNRAVCLTHLPLSWNGASWPFRHPLDYVGADGGGGIGAGPGVSVGAALALNGSGRMPIGICGDGDFLMGCTAVWTAVHYRIPLLLVIANNRSFFNDELHQERVARMRDRPVENRWIGQRISDPDPDLAAMARAQGAEGFGPVKDARQLAASFRDAIAAVEAGKVVVVDVHVEPGYAAETAAAIARGKE